MCWICTCSCHGLSGFCCLSLSAYTSLHPSTFSTMHRFNYFLSSFHLFSLLSGAVGYIKKKKKKVRFSFSNNFSSRKWKWEEDSREQLTCLENLKRGPTHFHILHWIWCNPPILNFFLHDLRPPLSFSSLLLTQPL